MEQDGVFPPCRKLNPPKIRQSQSPVPSLAKRSIIERPSLCGRSALSESNFEKKYIDREDHTDLAPIDDTARLSFSLSPLSLALDRRKRRPRKGYGT